VEGGVAAVRFLAHLSRFQDLKAKRGYPSPRFRHSGLRSRVPEEEEGLELRTATRQDRRKNGHDIDTARLTD
jgi:hypothetical protein